VFVEQLSTIYETIPRSVYRHHEDIPINVANTSVSIVDKAVSETSLDLCDTLNPIINNWVKWQPKQ
jgi:hypothetical protein